MSDIPSIKLQLGDIIEITSPLDELLHNKRFLIKYIDSTLIEIIDQAGHNIRIVILGDGRLQNESIESIAILSRPDSPSYAKQNNLLPGQWVDIHFGGDLPTIMTGEIRFIDEDQIEIKLIDNEVIYIDFAYKGIPLDLPIEKIIIRPSPTTVSDDMDEAKIQGIVNNYLDTIGRDILLVTFNQIFAELESSTGRSLTKWRAEIKKIVKFRAAHLDSYEKPTPMPPFSPIPAEFAPVKKISTPSSKSSSVVDGHEEDYGEDYVEDYGEDYEEDHLDEDDLAKVDKEEATVEEFQERVKKIIFDADQIQFGDKLGAISMMVEVPEDEKRFGIERQSTDLLNELLSTIPSTDRTTIVFNNIHRMIERYKQLRQEFSIFDTNGNALSSKTHGSHYKPLSTSLLNMNQKLYWILPVVENIKKLYDIEEEVQDLYDDVFNISMFDSRIEENDIIDSFRSGRIPDGQNGYDFLTKRMNSFWTPFDPPHDTFNGLGNTQINTNISSIVDNQTEFYSSVASGSNIKRKRFLMQEYNMGINTTETHRVSGGANYSTIKHVTMPDIMHIKSFITLPEAVVKFSHVNLPSTNILDRSYLSQNYLSNWRLLNDKTKVFHTTSTDNYDFETNGYLQDIREYIPIKDEPYLQYLNNIIPNTYRIFKSINKHISGSLSIHSILSYMEPFMIYQNDLSIKQYISMKKFLSEEIKKWKRTFVEQNNLFNKLNNKRSITNDGPKIMDMFKATPKKAISVDQSYVLNDVPISKYSYEELLVKSKSIGIGKGYVRKEGAHPSSTQSDYLAMDVSDVSSGYQLGSIPFDKYTSSEVLTFMNKIDYSIYFNTYLGKLSAGLMIPEGAYLVFDGLDDIEQEYPKILEQPAQVKCNSFVLAKRYKNIEDSFKDNNKIVLFDTQYDDTHYDLLSIYKAPLGKLKDKEKMDYLGQILKNKFGMPQEDIIREIDSIMNGNKQVKNGDYAVVAQTDPPPAIYLYYKRINNAWVIDESIPTNADSPSNTIFCNLTKTCISVKDQCSSFPKATAVLDRETITKMSTEFSDRLQVDADLMDKIIQTSLTTARSRLDLLINIGYLEANKYDKINYSLGNYAKEVFNDKSPHADLLNLILAQSDFVKRQGDISKFVALYTRSATTKENAWWRYCSLSGVKLLPTFISKLAEYFIQGADYFLNLRKIASEQGVLGSDGEAVVDKHSGWIITRIDFNTDEGFTEEGFVDKTRDILTAELGDAIAQVPSEELKSYSTPEAEKISKVVKALSMFLGLPTDSLLAFVISETTKLLSKSMPSREDYDKSIAFAISKGKKKHEAYEIVYDQTLIIITMAFLLIGIQTNIPTLHTRKTQSGCVKSFSGYPSFGNTDKSGIEYIACVAVAIKSGIEPWNALKKLNAPKIVTKMEGIINKFILTSDIIRLKIQSKIEHTESSPVEYIPEEHDIMNWINFLPPLRPVNITVEAPSKEFIDSFHKDIKSGSKAQFTKIDAMKSKIIYLTLSIEQSIQKTVNKNIQEQNAILSNSAKIPYLENACCNDSLDNTFEYFADKEKSIITDNNAIIKLQKIVTDVELLSKSPILYDPSDTRVNYDITSNEFTEETIYQAFIVYCKYNSNLPMSVELRAICQDKPTGFDRNVSIKEQIKELKSKGRNYDKTSLDALLAIVNRNNIVHLDLADQAINNIQLYKSSLSAITDSKYPSLPLLFISKMGDIIAKLKRKDPAHAEKTPEIRDMKNYLSTLNDSMENAIIKFIRPMGSTKIVDEFITCLSTITQFTPSTTDEKDDVIKTNTYLKNMLWLLINVYPNMVINQVNYNKIKIPMHWKLSDQHQKDIRAQAAEHYRSLSSLHGDKSIEELLKTFSIENLPTLVCSQYTIYISSILSANSTEAIRMLSLLFKFYILNTLTQLIELADRDEFYQQILDRPINPLLRGLEVVDVSVGAESVPIVEIMAGEKKTLSENIAKIITSFMKISCKEKDAIDYNYETMMEKVTRVKEKEKDSIVEFLTDLTDEEREIENMFKNHKIGRWSVGMQKGFRVYEGDTYDQERDATMKRSMLEAQLKASGVNDRDMDVFVTEAEQEADEAARNDEEAMNIEYNGEDDNIGDDEYGDEM